LAFWLIVISIILGVLLIYLLYRHFNVRAEEDVIFEDVDLPFTAKYENYDPDP